MCKKQAGIGIGYFFFISAIFLLLASLNIEKPTPGWEETFLTAPAISILKDRAVSPQFTTIQIGGRRWPIMEAPWIGAIESYIILPVYGMFGISIYTLRITQILLALIIGLLFGYLSFIMFNERVSKVAAPLILFNAIYLFYGRTGFQGVMLVLWGACALSLIFFWKWAKSKKIHWLYLGAFSMGLGMYGKLHFFWIVLGIIFGWILLMRSQSITKADAAKVILAFVIGFSPYIIENIRTQGSEMHQLINLFLHPLDGSSNLEYLKHLGIRLKQMTDAIQRTEYYMHESLLLRWLKTAPLILIGTLMLSKVRKKMGDKEKPIFFLLVCISSFMLGVSFKGTPLGSNHVLVALPLILICSAAMLNVLFKNRYCLIFAVCIILIPDFFIIYNYHIMLKKMEKSAIIELSNFLISQRCCDPILVNGWCLESDINTMSRGKVFLVEGQLIKEKEYEEYMKDKKERYILIKNKKFNNDETDKEGWLRFSQALQKNQRKVFTLKEYLIDGEIVSVCAIE